MSKETIYPKGLRTFPPRENAPSFVKGTLIISPNVFMDFLDANPQYVTEYKGEHQLKLNILEGDKGLYFTVDTYKKDAATAGGF